MKQKTIGLNPLEEYLSKSNQRESQEEVDGKAQEASLATPLVLVGEPTSLPSAPSEQKAEVIPGKQRITLHISAHVIDRLKNAVYWEPGLTLAGFAEEALEKALDEMEAERGKPFEKRRQHRLRGGRPII